MKEKLKICFNWLLKKLSEKSSWMTIFTILSTLFGVSIKPELATEITTVGMSLVSFIAFITNEEKKK